MDDKYCKLMITHLGWVRVVIGGWTTRRILEKQRRGNMLEYDMLGQGCYKYCKLMIKRTLVG